ncbi:MAG: insulinase family protein [Bacteroidetes bacterium]|nr:insulinase family protein [Bacteroidota bacterium]
MKIKRKLFNLAAFLFLPVLMLAQPAEFLKQPVPIDPNVKYGVLDNGMTYYIMHNEEPKDRASFYIMQNVGAVMEDDDQNGLAHFLEHMAFNGTQHFEGKGIINYLEQYGIAFGRNINAYTSLDETVYNLSSVPTTNQGLMDSCLLVLHDWSNYLLLTDEEIDAERGVIKEELRTRENANFRIDNILRPFKYKDSKYAIRDVIGDLDVIENFDYDVIRRFYHDWYRTDLQAIAIIGDFDAAAMEQKVIELFSSIPAVENPKERLYYEMPDNDEPIVAIATDPEAQQSMIWLYYKHDNVKKEDKNVGYYRNSLIQQLYGQMMNERFNEIVQKGNPPYIFAQTFYGSYTATKDAYTSLALVQNNGVEKALTTILIENERIRRFGFTAGELDRAKLNLLRSLEKAFKEKDKRNNDRFAREFKAHYMNNEPMPGIEIEFQFAQGLLPSIALAELNSLPEKWITKKNMILTLQGPELEGSILPTAEQALAIIDEVANMELEPYKDEVSDKPLVEKEPKGSPVVSSKEVEALGITEWILANGVKVIIKKTDFKQDEILLSAFSEGGYSLMSEEDLASASMLGSFIGMYGVGEFDNIGLQKMLAGKIVRVNPFLESETEEFTGNASPQDFETMLQLIYLHFENPRFDEQAHDAYNSRFAAFVENRSKDPNQVFGDSVSLIMANHHPRVKPMDKEYIKNVKFEKIKRIYLDRFKDASDFTFIFTGNIDAEEVKPLIEKYLGGLTDVDRKETWVNNHIYSPKGFVKRPFEKEMENEKSRVFINYNDSFKYSHENKIALSLFRYILRLRYTESIREEEGGTYGVGVRTQKLHYPEEKFSLRMQFDCAPEKADYLTTLIYLEVDKLIKDGPTQIDLDKARENSLKVRAEDLRKNRFWQTVVRAYYYDDENIVSEENFNDILESFTVESLKEIANKLFSKANKVEVIMKPKE